MLKTLTPRQKQIAVALAGAAVLAVIALLSRRSGAGAEDPAATDPTGGAAAPVGSTFADNGEAAGGLSTAITEGLGNVALGLDSVGAQQSFVADSLNQLAAQRAADSAAIEQALGNLTIPMPETFAPEPVAQAATDRTSRPAAPAAAAAAKKPANVFTQTKGTRAGRQFRLVVSRGRNVRLYESAAGRGDFGKKAGSRIVAGPNSKAAAKAKPKPVAKPKAAAKAKARPAARPKAKATASPSRRPASRPKPPPRKKRR
ncbi:MAG TPA: hypothetical protein VMY78_09910 [Solirubrobacteraceae bacterium]|nr:hypothetical protein [Solirubrobacteraceae bacterium]